MGHLLPQSADDALLLKDTGKWSFHNCVACKRDLLNPDAASTAAGWQETQISGMCEPCFDKIFEDR